MNYIIVNYHYIRPEKLRGLNPCTERVFEEQLKYIMNRYTVVSVPGVLEAARSGRSGRFAAITFDDGLREHYDFAFPIFKKHSIPGTFFISGEILRDKKVSLTHKLQILLLHSETAALVEAFHQFFKSRYRIDDKERINPRRRFDDVLTANFKEILIALPLSDRAAFINDVFYRHHNEDKIAKTFFLSAAQAREMATEGMIIGAHGFKHLSLEVLSRDEQERDIKLSWSVIQDLVGVAPEIFSYPHGRANAQTLEILEANGFKYGVTIKPEAVTAATVPFLIPRYDTNDININT